MQGEHEGAGREEADFGGQGACGGDPRLVALIEEDLIDRDLGSSP